jgi:hypothetical protein
VTPTHLAAAVCSALRSSAMPELSSVRSLPPASPSVTIRYVTSTPLSLSSATLPAAPKSASSGCADTTRTLLISLSGSMPFLPDGRRA